MKSTKEKVSYCIGLETGKNLGMQFADIDPTLLLEGVRSGLLGETPKLSQEEIVSVLETLRNQIAAQQKQYIARLAESNKKEGETFLLANKQQPGVVTLPSGLQYKILKKGEGPSPTLFDAVSIHYTGTFIDGRVFDSSHKRGEPTLFPLDRVIAGWSEALQLMQQGAVWQIFIPHYLAYGDQGFGREIPPNSTLIFEVELLAINP